MGNPDTMSGKPVRMDRPPVRDGFQASRAWLSEHVRSFGDPNGGLGYRDPYAEGQVVLTAPQSKNTGTMR